MKQSRSASFKPCSRAHSRQRDILAGKSSCPDIGKRNCCMAELLDVFTSRDVAPFLFEDRETEFVDFTLKGRNEACGFKTKAEPTDAREERGHTQRLWAPIFCAWLVFQAWWTQAWRT